MAAQIAAVGKQRAVSPHSALRPRLDSPPLGLIEYAQPLEPEPEQPKQLLNAAAHCATTLVVADALEVRFARKLDPTYMVAILKNSRALAAHGGGLVEPDEVIQRMNRHPLRLLDEHGGTSLCQLQVDHAPCLEGGLGFRQLCSDCTARSGLGKVAVVVVDSSSLDGRHAVAAFKVVGESWKTVLAENTRGQIFEVTERNYVRHLTLEVTISASYAADGTPLETPPERPSYWDFLEENYKNQDDAGGMAFQAELLKQQALEKSKLKKDRAASSGKERLARRRHKRAVQQSRRMFAYLSVRDQHLDLERRARMTAALRPLSESDMAPSSRASSSPSTPSIGGAAPAATRVAFSAETGQAIPGIARPRQQWDDGFPHFGQPGPMPSQLTEPFTGRYQRLSDRETRRLPPPRQALPAPQVSPAPSTPASPPLQLLRDRRRSPKAGLLSGRWPKGGTPMLSIEGEMAAQTMRARPLTEGKLGGW